MNKLLLISAVAFGALTEVAPSALEYTVSVVFHGDDTGVWTDTPPAGSTSSDLKFNSLRAPGGEETRDFSSAMDLLMLERIVKQGSSLTGSMVLTHPSTFLKKYQLYGPLAKFTITSNNQTDLAQDQVLICKGILKLPDMSFLDNPGSIDFELRPYGQQPALTVP